MSNTRNWGSMHSEFMCKFKVLSNHDHSTLEITFCSAQNLFCSHHKIRNCPTLEIGVQYNHNLHVNSQYNQIMAILPQKLLFAVHRNVIRYFHFGPMAKPNHCHHDELYTKDNFSTQFYILLVFKALSCTFRIIGNGNNQLFWISMSPQHALNTETKIASSVIILIHIQTVMTGL